MSTFEVLTLLVAILGVAVGFVALVRGRKLAASQLVLQKKQEELTDLQLELLRKQAEGVSGEPSTTKADVRASLEGYSNHHRFVITNWSDVPAKDVGFHLAVPTGRSNPLIQSDYDEKIPIPVLSPGGRCSLVAALSFDTGTVFDASWSWTNPDGTMGNGETRLTLP